MGKFISWAYLLWQFFLHWFRRLCRWVARRDDFRLFLDNYRDDRLLGVTEMERELQFRLGRCIGCGLCAFENDLASKVRARLDLSPAELALALSRSQPEFGDAVQWLDETDLGEISSALCPQAVPLDQAVTFIRTKFEELKTAL